MKSIRACASVSGSLRPEASPDHASQHFIVFLAELATESDSQRLLEIAHQKKPTDYGMIPLAVGPLFGLIVGRSFMDGIGAFETQETLARFAQPITDILQRHLANRVPFASSGGPLWWRVLSLLRRLASAVRRRLSG